MPNFAQVDVFSEKPFKGNPVAVVLDATGFTESDMVQMARWTNLSETTFVLPPTSTAADYALRIFTPSGELPFAGHPTLGSAHAWLGAAGVPADPDLLIQECGAGLVPIRRQEGGLAFAAPPLLRSGPVADEDMAQAADFLRIPMSAVRASNWVDNGPGWLGLLLDSAETVLALSPDYSAWQAPMVGVIGPHPAGYEVDYEVRAFCPPIEIPEDPVTGSLNAGLAQWLIGASMAPAQYFVRQGTVLHRDGRVNIRAEGSDVWVGGACVTRISGEVFAGTHASGAGSPGIGD